MKTSINKEEILAKLQLAQKKKQECLSRLEKSMKATYKKRMGKEPENFFAL